MRTWVLTPPHVCTKAKCTHEVSDYRCGQCGADIPPNTPMQLVELPKLKRRLQRCKACADGPAPERVPRMHESTGVPAMVAPMTRLGLLPLDFSKAAASREPGQEG